MAVTSRPCKRAGPYRTRLTGRLISIPMEGFGVTRRTPRHFGPVEGALQRYCLPCRRHVPALLLNHRSRGNVLHSASSCIRVATTLAAVAVIAAGCAAANNATSSQASAQGEQPYKTAYGISSEGTTTDLYTELFGSRQSTSAPATVAAAQPDQSVVTQPIAPIQQSLTAANPTRPAQATTATQPYRSNQTQTSSASRAPQPPSVQPAPVQVAQQPAAPAAPEEPDVPTAYGITANGPTTDLYTTIFGPRRSNGQ
jgi:hypothetical protein